MKSIYSLDGEYVPLKNNLDDNETSPLESGIPSYEGKHEPSSHDKKMSISSVNSVEIEREKVRSISVA